MKLTASYSICYARKKGEIKILTKSSSPHDKPIEKRSYTHARGTKNLALCVCLFLERECKDKWKKEKEKEHEKEYRGERGDIGNVGSHTQWKTKKDSHHFLLFLILLLVYLPLLPPLLGPYMTISLSLSLPPYQWARDTAFFHFLAFEEQWQFWLKISQSTPLFFGFSWFCRRWEMQVKHAYMSCDILSQDIDAHWKKLHEPWKQKKS
jgi:hypothetical protein